ncbi:hypothetical protein PM082_004794 [Marasmius tenuissimus]|nr:hypothetical protein PM082_004794 [Marasmius tenuissimus]
MSRPDNVAISEALTDNLELRGSEVNFNLPLPPHNTAVYASPSLRIWTPRIPDNHHCTGNDCSAGDIFLPIPLHACSNNPGDSLLPPPLLGYDGWGEANLYRSGHHVDPPTLDIVNNHRQVGSHALTDASIARRGTQRLPRYFCEFPGCSSRGFTAKHNYQYHMRAHRGESPFECPKCGRTFRSRSDLQRHESKTRKPCQLPRSQENSS